MPRGSQFALGKEPRRDGHGRSLPSDRSMRFVELRILCKGCRSLAPLAVFYVETLTKVFPGAANERLPNKAVVERQPLTDDDGSDYVRFKFRCPRCGAEPVLRAGTIDEKLKAAYEPQAVAKRVLLPI